MKQAQRSYSLSKIAELINAKVVGNDCEINGIAALENAQTGQISFLASAQYRQYLATTQASAVILTNQNANMCQKSALVVEDPYLSYAKVATLFAPSIEIKPGIHPTAVIGKNTVIASNAAIGPYCVIGDNVKIGDHTYLGPHCVIGNDCDLGNDCYLFGNITFYSNVKIGHQVYIHSGVVIGSDGFGLANDKGKWQKIPQLGGVIIGNQVEIGANTTIDRGALDNTVIDDGVKLDNQIQVAHNVQIGAHTAIAGCTGIAGSAKIGKHCMIGGGASIVGHSEIVDKVILIGTATVERSIPEPGIYGSGVGLLPFRDLKKLGARYRQLDDIARRLQKLEKEEECSPDEA